MSPLLRHRHDDDRLDGCGSLLDGESRRHPTPNEMLAFVVLFADVDRADLEAVWARRDEWRALFP